LYGQKPSKIDTIEVSRTSTFIDKAGKDSILIEEVKAARRITRCLKEYTYTEHPLIRYELIDNYQYGNYITKFKIKISNSGIKYVSPDGDILFRAKFYHTDTFRRCPFFHPNKSGKDFKMYYLKDTLVKINNNVFNCTLFESQAYSTDANSEGLYFLTRHLFEIESGLLLYQNVVESRYVVDRNNWKFRILPWVNEIERIEKISYGE